MGRAGSRRVRPRYVGEAIPGKPGGGAIWVQPALDPDLGLLYVNTGNPWPNYNGRRAAGTICSPIPSWRSMR